MCLGEVAQVVEVRPGSSALVRSRQRTATVSLLTLDEAVAPGDWVVCHSGFALGRVTPEEAAEATEIRSTAAASVTAPTPVTTPTPATPPTPTTTATPTTTPTPTVPPRKDPP